MPVLTLTGDALGPVDVPAPRVRGGTLGCGTYEVYVFPRGGGSTPSIIEVPWNTLSWSRVLDDTSEATIAGAVGDCCGLLQIVRPWRHEFAIYRDGVLVWQGPLIQVRLNPNPGGPSVQLEFLCRDLSAWWDRRLLHVDHDYAAATDLATIFQAYHDDAMAPDTSPNFTVAATPCGVTGIRTTLAAEYRKAGDEIRSISEIGIDWTVVARTALVGGNTVPTSPIATLVDEHFMVPPSPNLDGTQQANRWVLLGAGTNADGSNTVVGDASDAPLEVLDGLLEESATDTSVEDATSAQAGAASRVALTKSMIGVESAVLAPTAPVTIAELVPGATARLELVDTCVPVSETDRIKQMKVDVSETVPEVVTLTFQPEGST